MYTTSVIFPRLICKPHKPHAKQTSQKSVAGDMELTHHKHLEWHSSKRNTYPLKKGMETGPK